MAQVLELSLMAADALRLPPARSPVNTPDQRCAVISPVGVEASFWTYSDVEDSIYDKRVVGIAASKRMILGAVGIRKSLLDNSREAVITELAWVELLIRRTSAVARPNNREVGNLRAVVGGPSPPTTVLALHFMPTPLGQVRSMVAQV